MKQRPWDTIKNCTGNTGLVPRQMKLCRDNLDLMPTVVVSALLSVETCQKQFADRRWNCSSILRVPSLSVDLIRGEFQLTSSIPLYKFAIFSVVYNVV